MDLSFFTSPDDIRSYLHKPFLLDGWTVATNGWALIAIPAVDGTEPFTGDEGVANRVRKWLSDIECSTGFAPIPKYALPPDSDRICSRCSGKKVVYIPVTRKCRECDGEGEVIAETDYNEYEVVCKSCDGDGFVEDESAPKTGETVPCDRCGGTGINRDHPIKVGHAHIAYAALEVIGALPGAEMDLSAHKSGSNAAMIPFRFNGGIGVVMPMRV